VPPLSHLTSCTPTNSNLYLANYLAAAVSESHLYRLLTLKAPNPKSLFFRSYQSISRGPRHNYMFRSKTSFYGEDLAASHPPRAAIPPLVGCPLMFNQYIRSFPPYWKPFTHPRPAEAPCRVDMVILIAVYILYHKDILLIVTICLTFWRRIFF
jgi:hypothetical protein